jgi:adenosine deaminase
MIDLRTAPKIELHVHLEGAMPAATLLELADTNSIPLPFTTVEEARAWYRFKDFPHFAEVYQTISRCIVTAEDVERLARDFMTGQAEQGILYTEITYTALTHFKNHGLAFADQYRALERARLWAERELGASFGVIVDIPRDYATQEQSEQVARWVIDSLGETVIALGLGGYEVGFPPEQFRDAFDLASRHDVPAICHAGETEGPASIRGALDVLGSRRLGHGVRCLEDEALVQRLIEDQVVLEVCPSSEVCLGVFPSMDQHPLRELVERGLAVTINSDDPALFDTTMTHELELAVGELGLSAEQVGRTMVTAAESSLARPELKRSLVEKMRSGWGL